MWMRWWDWFLRRRRRAWYLWARAPLRGSWQSNRMDGCKVQGKRSSPMLSRVGDHVHTHAFAHVKYMNTYITLHYITLHYTTLYDMTLHYMTWQDRTLHYITYIGAYIHEYIHEYITFYYITTYDIALYCMTLHDVTLHYIHRCIHTWIHYITLRYVTLRYIHTSTQKMLYILYCTSYIIYEKLYIYIVLCKNMRMRV